jgi:membrane protease YdiL (CAAX protease family)
VTAVLDCLIALAFARSNPCFGLCPGPVPWQYVASLIGQCCAVEFAEELQMRAYLISRWESATGATWKAVLLNVAVSELVHLNKGYVGVIHSLGTAMVWSLAFRLTRRFWPLATSHTILDLVVGSHLGGGSQATTSFAATPRGGNLFRRHVQALTNQPTIISRPP